MSSIRRKVKRLRLRNNFVHTDRLVITEPSYEPSDFPLTPVCKFRENNESCTLFTTRESSIKDCDNPCIHLDFWQYQCLRNKVSLLCNLRCDLCEMSTYSWLSRCWIPNQVQCKRNIARSTLRQVQNVI